MSTVIDAVLLVLLTLALVPVSVLLVEVLAALIPRRPPLLADIVRPRVTVLVPAHDESAGILATLNSVLPELAEGDRLVVVADNCSDDTALVAAAAGAEVLERRDALRRGKGYALDFGVRHLARNLLPKAPDVVVIVDADCAVAPGSLERIARLSAATGRPVQSMYLMKAPAASGPLASIAEFAWIVKNQVRPLGALNLGLPCQLMGSGMALPWAAVRSLHLASGHLVEDMNMGVELARAGAPALYCPEALVTSRFAGNDEGARSQRTRWEHGHLGMILTQAPRLFLDAMTGMGSGLAALALDMCVPPLALLTLILIALCGVCVLNAWLAASLLPLIVAGIETGMFALAVGLSWWHFGRHTVSLRNLLLAFAYAALKLPLYVKFVMRREAKWVRSKRDGR